jgi:WD40 repeat protein
VCKAHEGAIYSLAIPQHEPWFLTASRDSTVKLWDRSTLVELERFTGHSDGVTSVRIRPDQQSIVTAGQDGDIKVWQLHTQESGTLLARNAALAGVLFTSGGRYLASMEWSAARLTFFDTRTGKSVRTMAAQEVAASADGQAVVVLRDSQLVFLDPLSLEAIDVMDCPGQLGGKPSFSQDHRWLALRRVHSTNGTETLVIDVPGRAIAKVLDTGDERPAPVFFARDGKLLITMKPDTERAVVWDTQTWTPIQTIHGSAAQERWPRPDLRPLF